MTASTWFGPTENPEADRWHGDLLTCDPSVRSPGVALFRHGKLIACDRVKIPEELHELPEGRRWMRVANEISSWWQEQLDGHDHLVRTFVYELPQIYSETQGKSKGDPNQLLGLVGVGQSLAVMLTMYNMSTGARPPMLLTPKPSEWTGQLPKTVKGKYPKDPRESPRGARIWARLQAGEREVTVLQHDAFDSIGLGLFALGRYERERVFPGAI